MPEKTSPTDQQENLQEQAPIDISSLSDDDLGDLADKPEALAAFAKSQAKDAVEAPAEEDAEEKTTAPTAEQTPQKEEEADKEDEPVEHDKVPSRVRLNALPEEDARTVTAAIEMVRANPSLTIAKAISILTTTDESTPAEADAPTDPIATIETEIAALRTELKQAKDDYDTEKEQVVLEKLIDAKANLIAARRDEQTALEQAEQQYSNSYRDAREKAVELYPDSGIPGSAFFNAVSEEVARIKSANPAFFNLPDYPLSIAGIVGARLGIAPKFAAAAQKDQPPIKKISQPSASPPRSPRSGSLPVLGGQASRETDKNDRAGVFRQVEQIKTLEELEALADAVGTIKSTKLTAD